MNKPKMILFDYGETLIYEPNFSPENGNAAIFPYIAENPHNISLEEFSSFLLKTFDDMKKMEACIQYAYDAYSGNKSFRA